MSFVNELKDLIEQVEAAILPAKKAIENEAHALENTAWTYIKTNGLHDLYQIAVSAVQAATAAQPWGEVLAFIEQQALAEGKQLLQGAVALVAAQAQADLIAGGKIAAPVAALIAPVAETLPAA